MFVKPKTSRVTEGDTSSFDDEVNVKFATARKADEEV
jgi:hypothetical protein